MLFEFHALLQDVTPLLSSFLTFSDLRSLVHVNHVSRRSLFHHAWLQRVRLHLPLDDDTATCVIRSFDAGAAAAITSITIANAKHLSIVQETFDSISVLRITTDPQSPQPFCGYTPMPALQLITSFRCLRSLDLSGPTIFNITYVAMLTELVHVDLSDTGITDLSALQSLTKLQVLNLSRTRITSIECVRHMPELRVLNVNATDGLRQLTPIAALSKLKTLSINHKNLAELEGLMAVVPTLTTLEATDLKYLGAVVRLNDGLDMLSTLRRVLSLYSRP